MTHTKIGHRQYDKPFVTVVDGVTNLDGDFNVLLDYPGTPAACIQAAIDSIKTIGGTIYIRAGSYDLETQINFSGATEPITITGDSDATVLTKSSSATGAISVLNPGDIGVVTVSVATPSSRIRFTRSAGSWAYQPRPESVLYVSGPFAAGNSDAFTVYDSTSAYIEVYPRVTTGGGGTVEGPITLTNVNNIVIKDSVFYIQGTGKGLITIEKLSFQRPATLGDGSCVFVEDIAGSGVTIQNCIFTARSNAFGSDILVAGKVWGVYYTYILRNKFGDHADPINGYSMGVTFVGSVYYSDIEENLFGSGTRTIWVYLRDNPLTPTTNNGHDIRIYKNQIYSIASGALAWPNPKYISGINCAGMWTLLDICDNTIQANLFHNSVVYEGIIVGSGMSSGISTQRVYLNIKNNDIILNRLSGTSNVNDHGIGVDYSSAYAGTSNRAFLVNISGNNVRTVSDLEYYIIYVRYTSSITFTHNQTQGNGWVDWEFNSDSSIVGNILDSSMNALKVGLCTGGEITGNSLNANAINYNALELTGSQHYIVSGNNIYARGGAGAVGIYVWATTYSTIGVNNTTQESGTYLSDVGTSFNVNLQIAKAWALTSGGGTLLASYNLTLTHTVGTGTYVYSFIRNMSSATYAPVTCVYSNSTYGTDYSGVGAGGFTLETRNSGGALSDMSHVVVVFGNSF